MTTCPKCHYTRQLGDAAPADECPRCGVIYGKYDPGSEAAKRALAERVMARRGVPRRAVVAAAIVLPLLAWSGYEQLFGLAAQQRAEQRHRDAMRAARPSEGARAAEVANSPWDGSVRQVERHLKRALHDPDSLQVIEWGKVVQQGDRYLVRVKYRAKNSVGGYVVEQKMVELDAAGQVTGMTDLGM